MLEEKNKKWIYAFVIILLCSYMLFRFADSSQIVTTFPFHYTNDISGLLAMLHFLDTQGYHAHIMQWYYPDGFTLYDTYPPGWGFFAYPFLKLLGDVKIAAFASLIALYIIAFFIFIFIGKMQKLSKLEAIAFYFLYFVSPMAVGDYIRQMRMSQLTGSISFLLIIVLLLYYKSRKINKKYFLIAPLFTLVIISHSAQTILMGLFAAGIVLAKKGIREKILACLPFVLGILISLPLWLYTFLKNAGQQEVTSVLYSKWMLDFTYGFKFSNIFGMLIAAGLFAIFAVYIYSLRDKHESRRELLFYSPLLIFNFLFLLRLIPFIPLLNNLYGDPILQVLAFFSLLLFFKAMQNNTGRKLKALFMLALVLMPVIFIGVSEYHTIKFIKPTPEEIEGVSILGFVEKPYLILGYTGDRLYKRAVYSYGAIYYNVTTASGWSNDQTTREQFEKMGILDKKFMDKDCKGIIESAAVLKLGELISYGKEQCKIFEDCRFKHKITKGQSCLYILS